MHKFKINEYVFSELEKSFIDGLLLGDAFINKSNFSLGLNTASMEFAEYVFNLFPSNIWTDAGIMKNEIYDERINKTLTIYRITTHANSFFEKERRRWYNENGKKRIPIDVRINKDSLLLWYLGDGTLSQHFKKKSTSEIKICTNSFDKHEIEKILIPKLCDFSAKIRIINKKEPVIIIPRKDVESFLNFIGEAPFSDYSHKWAVFPYKSKKVEASGVTKLNAEIKSNIVNDYINGVKITEIAKKYGICISHAVYFCKKNGVYDKNRDKKTYEIFKDGIFLAKVQNLKQFCKENGLCYPNLLCLCSGKIKKYKNYSIKKI